MSKTKAERALDQIGHELVEFALEPYVVGPTGLGVFKFGVSDQVSAYVSFSHFAKYQALGAYLGFGFAGLKSITDECLVAVGNKVGVVPQYALANSCPAILFPLEFFLKTPEAQPFKLAESVGKWARHAIYEQVILGTHGWLKDWRGLCKFLASDESPFSWATAEVPRRLAHVIYLARTLEMTRDAAQMLVQPAALAMGGDADFDGLDGERMVGYFLQHFYQDSHD